MENLYTLILVIIGCFVIYLLSRELNCWYWKINKRIKLLEEQNQLLSSLVQAKKIDMQSNNELPENSYDQKLPVEDLKRQFTAKEVTMKHKGQNKIERVSIEYWKQWVSLYGEDSVEIIEYHK